MKISRCDKNATLLCILQASLGRTHVQHFHSRWLLPAWCLTLKVTQETLAL
jgi:hypothetical protein